MRWRLILEEFGQELKYIKGENNVVDDALYRLDMNDKEEILNISEIYGYNDDGLPDSAYPIRYRGISKSQKSDAKLQQNIVSHKDYTLDTFRGSDKNHRLIFRNSKIFLPMELKKKTVYWYNKILCHLGETFTEHNIRQTIYWKGLHTTVHNVCKKCTTWQIFKKTNQKYGKLPPKQSETNPWDILFVDLIES